MASRCGVCPCFPRATLAVVATEVGRKKLPKEEPCHDSSQKIGRTNNESDEVTKRLERMNLDAVSESLSADTCDATNRQPPFVHLVRVPRAVPSVGFADGKLPNNEHSDASSRVLVAVDKPGDHVSATLSDGTNLVGAVNEVLGTDACVVNSPIHIVKTQPPQEDLRPTYRTVLSSLASQGSSRECLDDVKENLGEKSCPATLPQRGALIKQPSPKPEVNLVSVFQGRNDVRCDYSEQKGRILRSELSFKAGDVLFREQPLHVIVEEATNPIYAQIKDLCQRHVSIFELEPIWYWAAVCSLREVQLPDEPDLDGISQEQQEQILLLHHEAGIQPSEAARMLCTELGLPADLDPLVLERLLRIWISNGFEYSDDPVGYALYLVPSFISHSCLPNAIWQHDDQARFVLRARRDIVPGDEIDISYIAEGTLFMSTPARHRCFNFSCKCDRCQAPYDTSRGFWHKTGHDGVVFPMCSTAEHELKSEKFTEEEVQCFLAEERLLEEALEMCTSGSVQDVGDLLALLWKAVARAEQYLCQHCLLDKAWDLLTDLYDGKGRKQEAQECLLRRIDFQQKSDLGPIATHAWALEAYGDMLLRHHGGTVDPHVLVLDAANAAHLSKVVTPLYDKSLAILHTLFGKEHDHSVSVQRKIDDFKDEVIRHLGTGSESPSCRSAAPSTGSSDFLEDLSLIDT